MILVGEKLNSSIPSTQTAISNKDISALTDLAKKQEEAGVDYIDVNAGTFVSKESETLCWLIDIIKDAVNIPLMIDTPNPSVLDSAIKHYSKSEFIINSITFDRYNKVMDVIKGIDCGIIALCMDENGIPPTSQSRIESAEKLVDKLLRDGVSSNNIYLDPLVEPVSTNSEAALITLQTIKGIRELFKDVHIICGLSNVSYGLPSRKLINRTFLVSAMSLGLDAAIMDPFDKELMAQVLASDLILGQDEYCTQYLKGFRQGKL